MEGYLEKKRKSRLVSLWHRYWFVLEGAQLSYYDNRPTSAATATKGIIKLTSMTSVTAYSPTHRQPEPYVQLANCEIYILTSSKLFTLRSKDVNDHKMWMCALLGQIASLATGQNRGPVLSTRTTLAVPFHSSHINYRHSLTSLTTMEENDNQHLPQCSRTMEYKEFKSGSTGNMLDRRVTMANRETDTETSSEEDIGVKRGQDDGIDTATESLSYKCHTEEISVSTEISNEGAIIDEKMENSSERRNVTIVNDKRVAPLQQKVAKTIQVENKVEENEISKSKEMQSVQIQETKGKSRKFFGRREAKTNSVQMECAKVYKKSRETVVTDRVDADPKLFQAIKGEKRSKVEESYSKDKSMFKNRVTDSRSFNSSSDHKVSQRQETSPSERCDGTKLPNKPKLKRVKSKKENKGCPIDTQSYRKSKIAKTGELTDDGETKTKVKKMGFFSKLVKCKKNENPDEKTEELERDPSPDMSRQPNEDQPAEDASPERKTLHLPRHRNPMVLVPKDDAEFQKKLLSRKMKIEADQDSPIKATETMTRSTASSQTPLHEKDKYDDQVMTVNKEEAKPSLPPRVQMQAPPIPERKINPTQLDSKKPTENFPSINSRPPRLSPKSPVKYQNSGSEMKSNYDIVKFKVKKKGSVEKPAGICSQGMNPKVEYSFTSESNSSTNTREILVEGRNLGQIEGKEDMEVKVSEREKTEINFEEKFSMVTPTIILQEIPSVSSSIRSLNAIEIEEKAMLDADINEDKRDDVEIQTFFETSSLDKHSLSEQRNSPASSIPTEAVFSETPSHPSIYATTELSETPSSSLMKTYFSASSEEKAFNKVDELGLLLSELDRINSAPLQSIDSEEKPVLAEKEEKNSSSDKDDFLEAFPIRKRRGSDPDYDIPRPHRLPKYHQVSADKNDFSTEDSERKSNDTTNSITIEATCFLGPGMDQSFNENRYYGFSCNDWSRKSDETKHDMEYKYGGSDVPEEKNPFLQSLMLDLEDFEGKEMKESTSKCSEKHFEERVESGPQSKRDSEISVNLRPEKIDRGCRNERSREVYQSDLQDLLRLTETMEYLSINRTLDRQATETSKQDDNSSLQTDIPNLTFGSGESDLEEGESRVETAGMQVLDSIANANKMAVKSSTLADVERLLQETSTDIPAEQSEVMLRNTVRSDVRDNKTLRLSFATTETLIVEEEVLVASLKTTTTTTFSSPAEDPTNNGEREEELVEEVMLDMDSLSDDHFGSMKIQSCVQT